MTLIELWEKARDLGGWFQIDGRLRRKHRLASELSIYECPITAVANKERSEDEFWSTADAGPAGDSLGLKYHEIALTVMMADSCFMDLVDLDHYLENEARHEHD